MSEHDTHEHNQHKHVLEDDDMTPYQKFVARVLWKIFEMSTIEVVICALHLGLFAAVVFFGVGSEGGHG